MNGLTKEIYTKITNNGNALIAGKTDSGKTYFVEHELIPFLNKAGLSVCYFKNTDEFISTYKDDHFDVFIFDEFETFFDRDFLIKKHNDPEYYSEKYLQSVTNWHKALSAVNKPSIFILTRNEEDEISNIVASMKQTDFGSKVTCFRFVKTEVI
jgi:hypothetical protein